VAGDREKGNRENNSPPCWLLSVFTQARPKPSFAGRQTSAARAPSHLGPLTTAGALKQWARFYVGVGMIWRI